MTNNITIFNLLHFTQLNEQESTLFNFDKNIINRFIFNLDKGTFYLGGHIKMKHNDTISLDTINKVREIKHKIMCEYGAPRNACDLASVYTGEKELEFIENMLKSFILIMEIREKERKSLYNYPYYY